MQIFGDLNDITPFSCPGLHDEVNISTQNQELGLWEWIKNRDNVQSVHVGHDHGSNWCCELKNTFLCFARQEIQISSFLIIGTRVTEDMELGKEDRVF